MVVEYNQLINDLISEFIVIQTNIDKFKHKTSYIIGEELYKVTFSSFPMNFIKCI